MGRPGQCSQSRIASQYAHHPTTKRKAAVEAYRSEFAFSKGKVLQWHPIETQPHAVCEEDELAMLSWNPKDPFAATQTVCVHHLVKVKVEEIPDSEAVYAWDGRLSYSELDTLAEIAAARLVCLGVGPGVFVPFAYEKSMWTVVAMLAILKAGGAFVPLNPSDPPARLEEIVKKVGAHVVVTMEAFVPVFLGMVDYVEVISADTISDCDVDGMTANGHAKGPSCSTYDSIRPQDPVLVLFTSGSTGKPKGMIHEHAAISTHAVTHGESMGYHSARVLQFAAHTFDVAIIDVFTTLIFGGCICIPSEYDRRNDITTVINAFKVDYAILTPSFAGLIDPADVPTLKTVAIGGEALPQDRIERWADKVRFIQIYGPAEVGICMILDMHLDTPPNMIGQPLANSSCWLVDPDDAEMLVPIGAVGELIVAGPSLARGYLNDEAKTQTSFIPAPAWAIRLGLPFERFYKTGDLLKYSTGSFDGCFDFIGRKDSQIKLRGQRMDPGDVEYHVGRLPGVAVSMVTRPEKGAFAGELVAVVQMQQINGARSRVRDEAICLASVQSLSASIVRNHLEEKLPSYMVPTVCLVVESMPFVASLKIDRRAVKDWLMDMESRPVELMPLSTSVLEPCETTALELSIKVAELLASTGRKLQQPLGGFDFGLQDAGIDSIQIISLSMFLSKQYATMIPMNVLLSSKITIRELASLVRYQNPQQSNSTTIQYIPSHLLDISSVVRETTEELFRNIEAQSQPKREGILAQGTQNIFLTGATGYLGSAILQQLLAVPMLQVYALVRCQTVAEGLKRVVAAATINGWWRDEYASRLHIWQGDLLKPSFGLQGPLLHMLQSSGGAARDPCIHAIIHNGAHVHYGLDYETLKPINVQSTLELLQITAATPKLQTFVLVGGGEKPVINHPNNYSSWHSNILNQASGYTQTKFVSEQLVQHCTTHSAFRAKKIHTVKPGYIIGSLANGMANQSDFIWRLVAGCIDIAAYNRDEADHWIFMASVDRVASRIVDGVLSQSGQQQQQPSVQIDRILDGLRFSELWQLLEEVYGAGYFKALSCAEWVGKLRACVLDNAEGHVLFPLLHTLERDGGSIGEVMDTVPGSVRNCREEVRRNLRYLVQVGFLPGPSAVSRDD
ncbi:MAG: hypothetical protein Q9182_004076 [Xanthomendoza sp. 2 TL-2023]